MFFRLLDQQQKSTILQVDGISTCKIVLFCYADIVAMDKFTLDEIIERKIHLTDTGRTEKDFLELIESFYGKKTWWKDGETQLYVLYFKKIVQTNLFDQLP